MNILDIIFAVIAGFFFLRGLFRGLVVEVAAIAGLVGGFFLANNYYAEAAPYVAKVISDSSWIGVVSYLTILIGVVLITSLIATGLDKLLDSSPAAWLNHAGGGLIGAAKGLLLCCILLTAMVRFMPWADFLRESTVAPHLHHATSFLGQFMPDRPF